MQLLVHTWLRPWIQAKQRGEPTIHSIKGFMTFQCLKRERLIFLFNVHVFFLLLLLKMYVYVMLLKVLSFLHMHKNHKTNMIFQLTYIIFLSMLKNTKIRLRLKTWKTNHLFSMAFGLLSGQNCLEKQKQCCFP